jgi:phage shock protein C
MCPEEAKMTCRNCQTNLNESARFCSSCGCPQYATFAYARQWPRLERPRVGRRIAGVCAALANRFGWDPLLVRLIAVLAIFCGIATPIAYIIAWIMIPNEPYLLPQRTGAMPA